jgi:hypothetical protein
MTLRRHLGNAGLALGLSVALASLCLAQRQDHSNPPPRQEAPHSTPRSAPPRQQNAPPRQPITPQRREQTPPSRNDRPNSATTDRTAHNPNRPQTTMGPARTDRGYSNRQTINPNRSSSTYNRDYGRQAVDPNRPPSSQYSRGAENNYGPYRNNQPYRFTPEERQRVIQNQQRFRQLSPTQQQDMRERGRVWQQMTPQQRDHIRNEVLPTWRNLPPQRQRAIEQRLGVLQNMPESARNQHLADPNFTRGMSDEDRATLRDLSHLHVGGAPDAPKE